MTVKRYFLLGCLLVVATPTLNGMQKQRGGSAPELKKSDPELSISGVGLSGEDVHRVPRPATALGGRLVRGRAGGTKLRPPSQLSTRFDGAVEDKVASELRPTVRSVADREHLRDVLSKWRFYVADQKAALLNKLMGSSIRLKALRAGLKGLRAGKRIEAAVLFCDIRNFTSITELNDPQNIMGMLNEYFGSIVKIISKNHGVVDKFIGDAILAEFFFNEEPDEGEPVSRNAVCMNAIKSAVEITDFTRNFDIAKFKLSDDEEEHYIGGNRLKNGIGVTYGNVVFGALGAEDRCEITIIGDEVNLASRLQDLNKNPDIASRLDRPIIVSQAVHDLLSEEYEAKFVSLGEQHVKGKKKAVNAFGYGKKVPALAGVDDESLAMGMTDSLRKG